MFPKSFQKLIKDFASLPSVGPKMAERLVLYLFKQNNEKINEFAENLLQLKHLRICQKCFNISEDTLCSFCKDEKRDRQAVCVVEEPLDIISIERTKSYHGLYHVLGGVIQVGDNGNDLKIPQLISRVRDENIKEVILATNPTTEGDATALYLKRKLLEIEGVKITRLGRGLSTGADLEYADEITLSEALTNRKELV